MRRVRSVLWGLALLASATPVGAENWVVQIPVQTADGREVMLPLTLTAQTTEERARATVTRIAENYSRDSMYNFAWSLFPETDASQRIIFMKRGAQFWTVQHADDD